MTGIYAIHNVLNNKYYIGQSKNINTRWIQHKSRLKCNIHENKHLQNSYNIYGCSAFEYIILEECEVQSLDEKEKYYIQLYNSYKNGYNQDLGGTGCKGYKHTEEELTKMRLSKNPKAVIQLDFDLNIINEWMSCSHAGKSLNLSARGIRACCDRINCQKTIGGFYWVYKDEYYNDLVDWEYYLNINNQQPKRVSQYDFNMNLLNVYKSVSEAAKTNCFYSSEISSVCNYKKKSYKHYIWRYTDDYSEEQYKIDCNTDFNKRNVKRTPIVKHDLNMNLLDEYESISDAAIKSKVSISSIKNCLNGKIKNPKLYIWKYKN